MINVCLSNLLCFHTADPSAMLPEEPAVQIMERGFLDNFMKLCTHEPSEQNYSTFLSYFTNGQSQERVDNVCSWKGIECFGDVVQVIDITGMWKGKYYIANIEWIPPTTHVFSMRRMPIMSSWTMERLPRELRLFNLQQCGMYRYGKANPAQINFRALPPRIEEFYIRDHFCMRMRSIVIDSVPETLRWLQLTNGYLQKVNVAFERLPLRLEQMSFVNLMRKAVKIRGMGGVPCDIRVVNADISSIVQQDSAYPGYI